MHEGLAGWVAAACSQVHPAWCCQRPPACRMSHAAHAISPKAQKHDTFTFRHVRCALQSRLALEWREWLTNKLLGQYFADRSFYQLQAGALVDNPGEGLVGTQTGSGSSRFRTEPFPTIRDLLALSLGCKLSWSCVPAAIAACEATRVHDCARCVCAAFLTAGCTLLLV